jgi:hypothetical protein
MKLLWTHMVLANMVNLTFLYILKSIVLQAAP